MFMNQSADQMDRFQVWIELTGFYRLNCGSANTPTKVTVSRLAIVSTSRMTLCLCIVFVMGWVHTKRNEQSKNVVSMFNCQVYQAGELGTGSEPRHYLYSTA